MRIIFLKDTLPHGRKGEIKEVNSGFASNFLIPKGLVKVATKELQNKLEKEAKEKYAKAEKEKTKLALLKADLEKRNFEIKVKVGDKGQIFGGVHEKDVAEAVNAVLKTNFDKSQAKIQQPIKSLGLHEAEINLGQKIFAKIKIKVEGKE